MIRFLSPQDLRLDQKLEDGMFRDRARQFKDRLGWDVTVDENGHERDQYDVLGPLYVVYQTADGGHGGSMRLMPTTGRTMVNEHFSGVIGRKVSSPAIWECTRFCLSSEASPGVAAALMLAGGEILKGFGLTHFVGVFDARMIRVYRMLGGSPEILGMSGEGPDAIGVGLWTFTDEAQARLCRRAGVTADEVRDWFEATYPAQALAS